MTDFKTNTYVILAAGPLPVDPHEYWLTPTPALPGAEPGGVSMKIGDIVLLPASSESPARMQISLGLAGKIEADAFRRAGCEAARWMLHHHIHQAAIEAGQVEAYDIPAALQAFCEGLLLGSYRFHRHRQPEVIYRPIQVTVRGREETQPELIRMIRQVTVTCQAANLARDWANEPANVINPLSLAERAAGLAEQTGLKCSVLDERQLSKIGASGILSVGKGSLTPPRLIVLEYPGHGEDPRGRPVVLVGKAVTFDSGGYSKKSVEIIQTMKFDKSGGLAVLGAVQAAAQLELKPPLVGIICAAENMISGSAYRPDDIITCLSGTTVEIVSTDFEGRLLLADGLTYAQRSFQPRYLIDVATLTRGISVSLGRFRAGLFTNHDLLAERLIAAGNETAERLWRMPLDEDYLVNIEGDHADLKNDGGDAGHAIYGALFLQQFVQSGIPWAHLDIRGVAINLLEEREIPVGATGYGARLLIRFLQNLEDQSGGAESSKTTLNPNFSMR